MKIPGIIIVASLAISGCVASPANDERDDLGIAWVKDSAEYQAVSLQVFQSATRYLPEVLNNKDFSALPDQNDAALLPPAIILDVDETALTNPVFQASFERPFSSEKLDDWSIEHDATPTPGAVAFLTRAKNAGVAIFFVTNRPCERRDSSDDPCPQKRSVIDDLVEAGLPANSGNVSLAGERHDWGSEKQTRRDHIAQDFRVIMLFGDDLSDFIPCVRLKPEGACTEPATAEFRQSATHQFSSMWGTGWYVLPNPMHGSWTSFR